MAAEQEDAQPTTTQGSGEVSSSRMTALRWVYPPGVQVAVLADTKVVIGRDPSCQVRLDTSRISRRHVEIRPSRGLFTIHDLESKNGVHLNGKRVTESELTAGDVLRLGNFVAVVESVDAAGLPGFRDLGHGIHGGSTVARALSQALHRAADHQTILFEGDPGTGKQLFARAVHRSSGRDGPFVPVRAGSASKKELEVALAVAGTVYVEDLPGLPVELQEPLLAALEQDREGRVLFGTRTPLAHVPLRRLSLALRARLEERVVALPPLRRRRADIVPSFLRFLSADGDPPVLEHELVESLCLAAWPLNVLELGALAERLLALHPDRSELKLADLAEATGVRARPPPEDGARGHARRASSYPKEQVAALKEAIDRHGGNLTKAANELGITRPKAYRILSGAAEE